MFFSEIYLQNFEEIMDMQIFFDSFFYNNNKENILLRRLHNMMQRLRKLDARIEIISILASEVGVLGNAPIQRFRLHHNILL